MDNTLPSFIDYFRQLVTEHVELQTFVHGAAGRIIAGTRSGFTYPVLWLETPSMGLTDKDGTTPFGQRASAFVVLHNTEGDSYADQDKKWASTEALALEVLSRLRHDKKTRRHTFDLNGGQLEAVATMTVDNEIGWRYEFSLGDYVSLKYDATRWEGKTV
ncbi:hypothetical protein GO988_15995 [Hymenobacter sp. HMF4947]|uniref:Uncharacterized protein n=1 Tax=Hymenobacter ginkgonis TaxID=2682976 RepID=A0A7K1THG1_9BACT|nr:hypothetical protein [Hymenobacter ginkgonis]MVN77834.1 hypothetical protein [Hymenobacter ginkgonis]